MDTRLTTPDDVPESPLTEKSDDIQTGTIPKTSKGKWKSDTHWKKDTEKAPTTKKTKTMKDKKETKKVVPELL